MGKHVHVAVKYEVSYDSSCGFNWHNVEFKELLQALNVSTHDADGELTDGFSDTWECPSDEYNEALAFLKEHKEDIRSHDEDGDEPKCNGYGVDYEDICDSIIGLECGNGFDDSYEEVVKMMELFQKQAATSDGYMHFCAF